MKPMQIALLVVAGAITGAVVMKVRQRPDQLPPVIPAVVEATVPSPVVPAPVEPTPAGSGAVEQSASQAEATREPVAGRVRIVSRPVRERPVRVIASYRPETIYRVPITHVPAVREEAAAPATPQAPEVPRENPASSFSPPARIEPEQATPAPPPPPEPHKVTLNAGLLIPVRLVDGLSAERNRPGDIFSATLDKELVVDEFVIAERGARVEGRVVSSEPGGKTKGVSALAVELTRLNTSDGQSVAIRTGSFERRAEPSTGEDAGKIAAGAVLGAIVGAAAAGGKGAAAGAGIGGAAGTADVLLTRGKPVSLASETRITFRLDKSVTLTEQVQ